MTFRTSDKVSKQIYCSDICWQTHWINTGVGLVHPTCPSIVLNFVKEYGDMKTCKQVLKAIEN